MGVETEVNAKLSPTELKLELGLSLATFADRGGVKNGQKHANATLA